jgi:membrane protease YdiL (CAAX protease family)
MTINDQPSPSIPAAPAGVPAKKVNWKQVGIFIGLTFGLTWALDLVLYLKGGLGNPAVSIALQFQMLLPAFSAMILGMFFFKDSPIHLRNNHSKSRWFIWYFLLFTLIYAVAVILAFVRPELIQTLGTVTLVLGLLGMVLVIILRAVGGKDTFAGVGMGGGKAILWLLFGLGMILFVGLQTLMNWLFKMGQPADLSTLLAQVAGTGMTAPVLMVTLIVQTMLVGPFLGLLVTFGEEYGWRGFLQTALMGLGRVRGVALLGLIWGAWHWPVIWMGYNYPGHPYLGSLLMLLFSTGLAFILGYAVLKAKGVWIAAFLHALFNQSLSFFMGFVYTPTDPAFSFGIGLFGAILFTLVVLLILRDPIWRQKDSNV